MFCFVTRRRDGVEESRFPGIEASALQAASQLERRRRLILHEEQSSSSSSARARTPSISTEALRPAATTSRS